MRGKIAPGMSDIGLTLSSKESKHDIVEDRQHFRRMAHTNLSVVFLHGDIASMMQPILNAPMTSRQCEESFGISQIPWETGHAIAHLCLRLSQRVGM
jgi:hypothetical protein